MCTMIHDHIMCIDVYCMNINISLYRHPCTYNNDMYLLHCSREVKWLRKLSVELCRPPRCWAPPLRWQWVGWSPGTAFRRSPERPGPPPNDKSRCPRGGRWSPGRRPLIFQWIGCSEPFFYIYTVATVV